jgi:predicted RecA/RadA family phage recombinase
MKEVGGKMPATMNPGAAKGKNASTPLIRKRFVKLDTAATDGETVKACDTNGELAYGVSLFSVSNAEINRGKGASVIIEGRAILEASEAIAVGQLVSTTNDGRAQVATTGEYIIGVCDEPATGAGKECSVHLERSGAKA